MVGEENTYTVSQCAQKPCRIWEVHRRRAHGLFEKVTFCFLVCLCTRFHQSCMFTYRAYDSTRFVSERSSSLVTCPLETPPQRRPLSTISARFVLFCFVPDIAASWFFYTHPLPWLHIHILPAYPNLLMTVPSDLGQASVLGVLSQLHGHCLQLNPAAFTDHFPFPNRFLFSLELIITCIFFKFVYSST